MVDLKCSRTKAIRTMKTLELLELVTLEEETLDTYGGEQKGYSMKLKDEFSWFKSAEFKQLWRLKVSHSERQNDDPLQVQTLKTTKLEIWQEFVNSNDNEAGNVRRPNTDQEG